jgi:hypothetical protein
MNLIFRWAQLPVLTRRLWRMLPASHTAGDVYPIIYQLSICCRTSCNLYLGPHPPGRCAKYYIKSHLRLGMSVVHSYVGADDAWLVPASTRRCTEPTLGAIGAPHPSHLAASAPFPRWCSVSGTPNQPSRSTFCAIVWLRTVLNKGG